MESEEIGISISLDTSKVLDVSNEDHNSTILHFNLTHPEDITVYEVQGVNTSTEKEIAKDKPTSCEGSDSGVEVLETPEAQPENCSLEKSSNSNYHVFQNVTPARSCESSLASCCSQYEEPYNGTSEGGSESSLVLSPRHGKRAPSSATKKKDALAETKVKNSKTKTKPPTTPKTPGTIQSNTNSTRKRVLLSETKAKTSGANASKPESKTSNTSKTSTPSRTKSIERQQRALFLSLNGKNTSSRKPNYNTLPLSSSKKEKKQVKTPTDDGRWPSINSKPAPLISRSSRGAISEGAKSSRISDIKSLDKHARDRSLDTLKSLRPKSISKTKLYYEMCVQTSLSIRDIDNAFPDNKPIINNVEKVDQELQVDTWSIDEEKHKINHEAIEKIDGETQVDMVFVDFEKLQNEHADLICLYEKLKAEFDEQQVKLQENERKLREEIVEKKSLKEELRQNTERIQAILANESCGTSEEGDSLLVLESKFQNVSEVIVRQENEISKLNASKRALQRDLSKCFAEQKQLMKQLYDQEIESGEMQDFLQAEKMTLTEALKEMEISLVERDKKFEKKKNENDQLRLENVSLQARLAVMEGKCKELLVHQGSATSGAAVALSALISRLDGLVEELITSYKISEQELDDAIYHNEVYTNSSESPIASPENYKHFVKDKTPSPTTRGSFISAILNAIKNATSQSPFSSNRGGSRDRIYESSSVPDLLDSETEPCLMMEPVLEDVVIPDSHSHNMISSGHSMFSSLITRSESLENIKHSVYSRQMSEPASFNHIENMNASYTSDISTISERSSSVSVVDQVIDVDNLITRLLKVIRIIQMDTDDSMVLLQKKYEELLEENELGKETKIDLENKLKEYEKANLSLKQEMKKLQQQVTKKNAELSQQRSELEKLNHDVCEISTALSKTQTELKDNEEKIVQQEKSNDIDLDLKEKLVSKEKQLNKLAEEHEKSKNALLSNLRKAMSEIKKHYDVIDGALETLHSLQSIIQQYPPLVKLQRELEELNFQSASSSSFILPPDCNANAALLQALSPPINTTA